MIKSVEDGSIPLETISDRLAGKVGGMSGRKFRTLAAGLAALMHEDAAYLELGVYQGMTPLVVAASVPERRVIGVDNFSEFDKDGTNYSRLLAAQESLGVSNLEIHSEDFEVFLDRNRNDLHKAIGVYFFDASHDFRSQVLALMLAPHFVAQGGIIIVDDCNYAHVRQATIDFLNVFPEFKLVFESYTGKHPTAMEPEELESAKAGWWNGVNVLIHDPEDNFQRLLPPVSPEQKQGMLKWRGVVAWDDDHPRQRMADAR